MKKYKKYKKYKKANLKVKNPQNIIKQILKNILKMEIRKLKSSKKNCCQPKKMELTSKYVKNGEIRYLPSKVAKKEKRLL